MLCRLIYASLVAEGFEFVDMQSILEKAQRNNPALGITGLLIMASGRFLQVIEGPSANVNRLYRKICDDRRHRDCQLIEFGEITTRLFEQWSMRGIHPALMDQRLKNFLLRKYGADGKGGVVIPDTPFAAASLLYDLAHAHAVTDGA